MVERFTSKPLELPDPSQPFTRADLIIYGVDPSAGSYEGRVFFSGSRRLTSESGRERPDYAGSFYVFGDRECAGDVGHCELPGHRDPFDLRLPHHLEPGIHILTVTERLRGLLEAGKDRTAITVIADAYGQKSNEVLAFTAIRLATYD